MKAYLLNRWKNGDLTLVAQALVKGKVVETSPPGHFDIGNSSDETKALASAIMRHYYGASPEDLPAWKEAERQAPRFLDAFLLHHQMPPGARYEISSDVLDAFFSLAAI